LNPSILIYNSWKGYFFFVRIEGKDHIDGTFRLLVIDLLYLLYWKGGMWMDYPDFRTRKWFIDEFVDGCLD
jgi:hypothetical protein